MPGERVDAGRLGTRGVDPDAAFRRWHQSWLEEESAEETARRSAKRSFVRAGASADVPLDAFLPALGDPLGDGAGGDDAENAETKTKTKTKTSDASDLRGAVGRMRFELGRRARRARTWPRCAFLDLSGRKRLGADTPRPPRPPRRPRRGRRCIGRRARGVSFSTPTETTARTMTARATEKSSVDVENVDTRRGSLGVAARSLSEPAAS